MLDAEDFSHVVALIPCLRVISLLRQNRLWKTDALRDDAGHLHGLDAEILRTQEFKFRSFRQHRVDLHIDAEIAGLKVLFLDNDLPAFDLRKADTVFSLYGLHVFDALDGCKFTHVLLLHSKSVWPLRYTRR